MSEEVKIGSWVWHKDTGAGPWLVLSQTRSLCAGVPRQDTGDSREGNLSWSAK